MKVVFASFAGILALSLVCAAQQPVAPALQPRTAAQADEHPVVVLRDHAKKLLPDDASGLYRFGDQVGMLGEGIQIDEQLGDVTGYVTIKVPGGKPMFQAYFFSRLEGGNGSLSFTTKAVHGIWYSFDGNVTRGPGASRADDGYYLMTGPLITHDDTRNTTQQRAISLKLTAQH